MNLTKNCKVILAKAGQSSAGTAVNSDVIDMEGYEGVVFVGSIATVNAANFAKVQQGKDSGLSDAADLEGTKVVPGDDGDSFMIDVYKPQERYVRCVVDRGGANTATGDIYAIQYGAKKAPISHGATIDSEAHVSPAEGTA
jgi:hypothetical protein